MTEMNARVRFDNEPERIVAADFLNRNFQMNIDTGNAAEWRRLIGDLWRTTLQHLLLVFVSLGAAICVALPLGIASYKWPPMTQPILGLVGIVQTIPSMAVLVFMIPLLGLGWRPAAMALFLYSLLPIVRNTYNGLAEIPPSLKESALVLGLDSRARLWWVELPMASRSILAGIKTAAVINVGTATIGGLIGAGGYGEPILTGIRLANVGMLLQGAVPAAIMALAVQAMFDQLERFTVSRGLRLAKE
jgi:osmoprotectant transport system permease protein